MSREKLDKIVNLRVTQNTKVSWEKAAVDAGLNLGDWLRLQIDVNGVTQPPTRKPTPQKIPKRRRQTVADPQLVQQICKIGNNINQIGRWCNTYKSSVDSAEVVAHLRVIEQMIDTFLYKKNINIGKSTKEYPDAHQI